MLGKTAFLLLALFALSEGAVRHTSTSAKFQAMEQGKIAARSSGRHGGDLNAILHGQRKYNPGITGQQQRREAPESPEIPEEVHTNRTTRGHYGDMPYQRRPTFEYEKMGGVMVAFFAEFCSEEQFPDGFVAEARTFYAVLMRELTQIKEKVFIFGFHTQTPEERAAVHHCKQYFSGAGVDLKYVYIVESDIDSVWIRDFGPFIISDQYKQEFGVVDGYYYPFRPLDDNIPFEFGQYMKIPGELWKYKDYKGKKQDFFISGGALQVGSIPKDKEHGRCYLPDYHLNDYFTNNLSPRQLEKTMGAIGCRYGANKFEAPANLRPTLNDCATGHLDMYVMFVSKYDVVVGYYKDIPENDFHLQDLQKTMDDTATQFQIDGYRVHRVPMPSTCYPVRPCNENPNPDRCSTENPAEYVDCANNTIGFDVLVWVGDGVCDDGFYGVDFLCEAWGYDANDCESPECEDDPAVCDVDLSEIFLDEVPADCSGFQDSCERLIRTHANSLVFDSGPRGKLLFMPAHQELLIQGTWDDLSSWSEDDPQLEAAQVYQSLGFKVVPMNFDEFIYLAGAIHCVAMGIPANLLN